MSASDCRLLLSQAVERSESPNQLPAINSDDAASWKTFAQGRQRCFVSRVGECWYEHASIRDVKVRVTCRQPQTFALHLFRHRQSNDLKVVLPDSHLAQARKVFLERLVIFVVAIFFHNSNNCLFGDKPREIVDMSVGVVASNAVTKPQDIADTQIVPQTPFDFIARKIWVPIFV